MGSIMSPNTKLDSLRLVEVPSSKVIKVVSATRVGDTVVLKKNDHEVIILRHRQTQKWAWGHSDASQWIKEYLSSLFKLGLASKKDVEDEQARRDLLRKKRDVEYELKSVTETLAKYGTTLTATQLKAFSK